MVEHYWFLVARIFSATDTDPVIDWRFNALHLDADRAVQALRAKMGLGDEQPLYCAGWTLYDRVEEVTALTLARVVRPEFVLWQQNADMEPTDAENVDRFVLVPYSG